jgi:hypothetical protein
MKSNIKFNNKESNIKFNNKELNIINIKFNKEEYDKTKFRFNIPTRNISIKPDKNILNDDFFNKQK